MKVFERGRHIGKLMRSIQDEVNEWYNSFNNEETSDQ